ncbi:MAG TPA: porin [Gammaproteobacteria bacterium]|nr:porin [Gammaproteobacteria bacterium]
MNKKLIVTAMSLVMAGAAGLASADVKLYGQLDVSLDWTDSDVAADNGTRLSSKVSQSGLSYEDDINMNSNTSALGVKGSEDLGNGMSAIFKVEWDADLVNGGSFKGRDQWIGLKMERFGKLTFGTMSTAYKAYGSKIDAFYRTPLQMRAVGLQSNLHSGKGEEGQGRATNTARYDSPSFGGFSAIATYTFDSNKQGGAEDDDPYSLGIQYKGGNFWAAASYISTQGSDDAEAAQFLARYNWNNLSFHGIYELDQGLITAQANNGIGQSSGNLGRTSSAKDDGADIWSLGVTYTIGNNLIAADYGQRSDSDGVNGVNDSSLVGSGTAYDDIQEATVWRLAAYHKFSNRTRVYAGYANSDYDDKGEDEIFTLGMRHNF